MIMNDDYEIPSQADWENDVPENDEDDCFND